MVTAKYRVEIGSYRLNLTGIDLNDTNSRRNKFLPERICEGADSRFGGTVDATAGIRLAASNGANVNYVTTAALVALLEDGQNGLGHVDQTGDVGVEHDLQILGSDFRCLSNSLYQATACKVSIQCRDWCAPREALLTRC
jgi:hypothetical protein